MDTKPTHRFEALVNAGDRKVRVKGKIIGTGLDAVKESVVKTLAYNNLPAEYVIVGTPKIVALPVPKVGARINRQHDYITVAVQFPEGKLTMTWSRFAEKMSGDLVRHPLCNAIIGAMRGTAATKSEAFFAAAQKATSFEAFASAVTA